MDEIELFFHTTMKAALLAEIKQVRCLNIAEAQTYTELKKQIRTFEGLLQEAVNYEQETTRQRRVRSLLSLRKRVTATRKRFDLLARQQKCTAKRRTAQVTSFEKLMAKAQQDKRGKSGGEDGNLSPVCSLT